MVGLCAVRLGSIWVDEDKDKDVIRSGHQVKLCVELDSIECRSDFEGKVVMEDGLNSLYHPMTIVDRFKSSNWICTIPIKALWFMRP